MCARVHVRLCGSTTQNTGQVIYTVAEVSDMSTSTHAHMNTFYSLFSDLTGFTIAALID
jgi:hypothetical protein